jgi:hypothetical protein
MLDFAGYYGFVPRVCRPYRPETKGKIESTVRFIKGNFWPGIEFDSLKELNRQGLAWCGEVNGRVHSTTREIPQARFSHEGLTPLNGQPAYDTSYVSHRQGAKDCLFSYRGNRYSVPHAYAGKSVLVREPLDAGTIRVFDKQNLIAQHKTATGKGAMVVEATHYAELPRRSSASAVKPVVPAAELSPGPGVGLHYPVPEVEFRPLSIYNAFCEEVAHVASV